MDQIIRNEGGESGILLLIKKYFMIIYGLMPRIGHGNEHHGWLSRDYLDIDCQAIGVSLIKHRNVRFLAFVKWMIRANVKDLKQ